MSNQLEELDELKGLSEQERDLALKILLDYQNSGESKILEELKNQDFKEQPVDIITFIKDRQYLGDAWHAPGGKCKLFPYWEEKLKELFPDNVSTSVNTFILSGARGLGKSEIAVTCCLYMMHRLMCLRNPYEYLNLKPTEKIAFSFMNITESLAKDIGVTKFQNTVQCSPWFMARGTLSGRRAVIWNPPDFINIIIGSQPGHVIGQATYCNFFDEISFIKNCDIEIQKQKALDLIDTAIGGMKTRFTNKGKTMGLVILASSKRSEKSFLETHIKKKAETDGDNTLVVDEPTWNVRPASEFCGKRFHVALGNKFLQHEIIPDEDTDFDAYRERGYRILDVPVEYRAQFLEDIDRALCDYAGISSSEVSTYISGQRLAEIKHKEIKNAFVKDIIEVGNAPDDKSQYWDYFDMANIPPQMKQMPLYVHLDMSISGDKTGIAGTWIKGKKVTTENEPQSKDLVFQPAFSVSVKAPKGYQVSFEKNRQFIRWLKQNGFNVKCVSFDTFQSADLGQQLTAEGFTTEIISVDRVDSDRICKPYHYFKSAIYEKRILLYDKCDLLTDEILQLERNINTGKIDHADQGRSGSKDQCDAVCGSIFSASKHAEEFSFDYGDNLDAICEASNAKENNSVSEQMEQELNKMFDPIQKKCSGFMDFGFGAAQPYQPGYEDSTLFII